MGEGQRNAHTGKKFQRKYVIDLLLPAALFLALAASSLLLVILAANVYKANVLWEESNYKSRTCLSYVTEKIRQGDVGGDVETGVFNGIPCLVLRQTLGEQAYVTYLYSYQGKLHELFVQEGISMRAPDGQGILEVDGFRVAEEERGIFRISCLDENGRETVAYASVKSKG